MATASKKIAAEAAVDPRLAAARKAHAAKKSAASEKLDPRIAAGLKATVVDTPEEPKIAGAWDALQQALDRVQQEYGICSWKRYVSALVLGSVVSFGTGYLLGTVLEILVTSVFMAGYTFLGWAILIIGAILAIAAGAMLGRKAFNYVAGGHIDLHYAVAKGAVVGAGRWFGSLFSSKDEVITVASA